MKKTKSKQTSKRRKKRAPSPREYRMPHTAAELGIVCAECGAPAEWFDYDRAREDHRRGFICNDHPRGPGAEKLLVKKLAAIETA